MTVRIGSRVICGPNQPLALIAGPCALEHQKVVDEIIEECKQVCGKHGVQYVFKASFDKANRTSIYAARGPGIDASIEKFLRIRREHGVPVVTDIHQPQHAEVLAECIDMIQIPAMLMRQTDLLKAAALSKLPVLVKKQQSASPDSMRWVQEKLEFFGCRNMIFCDRGTSFGYGRLVNDMTGLVEMRKQGVPVAFDATHSVQRHGSLAGGEPEMIVPLARAASAVGIDALFLEVHPEPHNALSDGGCMLQLGKLGHLIKTVTRIRKAIYDP